jgi:hypothetical protein
VDDGLIVGPIELIDEVLEKLKSYFKLKVTEELTHGKPEKLLGGYIMRVEGGFVQYCKESYVKEFLEILGLSSSSSVATPGEKADMKTQNEEVLPADEASLFRRATGIALFIGRFRPECQYAIKECSRGMSNPTAGDLRRLKRVARYLRGRPSCSIVMKADRAKEALIECYCDSDWATDKVERKSTTGVVMLWCGVYITSYSRTQGTIATSSTEAECYALSSGGAEGLGLRALLLEMGVRTEPVRVPAPSQCRAGLAPAATSSTWRSGISSCRSWCAPTVWRSRRRRARGT